MENKSVSIVLMGAKRNEIFCVSDSRSTNTADHSHEDSWKKIIKMKTRNMILAVAGENSIKGTNILNIIEQLELYDNNESKSNYDFLKYVTRYLILNKSEAGTINLFAGYFNDGIATIKSFDITPIEIIENTYGNNQITFQGAAYSNYLLKNFDCSMYSNAKEAIKYFSSFVEDVINLNEYLVDSPIGGYFQYETAVSESTDNFSDLFSKNVDAEQGSVTDV
ncbi:MAG: hypothetical protein IJ571_06105 [Ruminococcus sp.]|nr:hypothetical protein [Ruminococcus sp.]